MRTFIITDRPSLFCFDQTEVYGSDKRLAEALGNCISRSHSDLPNHLTIVTTNATNWTADILPNMKRADQDRFSDEIRLEGIERNNRECSSPKGWRLPIG